MSFTQAAVVWWGGCAATAILLALLALPSPASPRSSALRAFSPDADQQLLLEVDLNGQPTHQVVEFVLRKGAPMAKPAALRGLRIVVPENMTLQPGGLVSLDDLPGLKWKIDQAKQALHLTASVERLLPTTVQIRPWDIRRTIESGTGATLNYDAVGTFTNGQAGGTTSLDLRFFSSAGIANSDWLTYEGVSSARNTAVRLDSAYTYADVNTLRRYSLGDFINSGLSWTRPVHLEGVQIRSDFSTRPDLITFPMPSLKGAAAVASTVTVLANGSQISQSQVEAGPFQMQQLPVVNGAGTLTMTVTDALGKQVTINQRFYASNTLLAAGLQTFAVQAGMVRRNWGLESYAEGKAAGSALYRRGLSSWFTLEGSMEGTPGAFMAGAGAIATLRSIAVVNVAVAGSDASGDGGRQFAAGVQRIGRVFSLGGMAIVADRKYRDLAAMNGTGVQRKQLSLFSSVSYKRMGALSGAYAALDQDAPIVLVPGGVSLPTHSKVLTGNYTRSFRHFTLMATANRSFGGTGNRQFQFGLSIPLGRRRSAFVTGTADGSGQAQVQQSALFIGDWGYQGYVSADGATNHEFLQGQYKSHVGLFTAGVDEMNAVATTRIEDQAAISFVDGRFFPSNFVYDSFGIVDTAPVPHVHVLQENRTVGTTDSSGRMLVPDMRSFELNRIAIEATDIPPDATLPVDSFQIRPQDRSGVVVKFPTKFSHGALLKLIDEGGVAIPIGSTATLATTGVASPVGYSGETFVENLAPHNEVAVKRPDGRTCTVRFDYQAVPGDIPKIGPLRCVEKKP